MDVGGSGIHCWYVWKQPKKKKKDSLCHHQDRDNQKDQEGQCDPEEKAEHKGEE